MGVGLGFTFKSIYSMYCKKLILRELYFANWKTLFLQALNFVKIENLKPLLSM